VVACLLSRTVHVWQNRDRVEHTISFIIQTVHLHAYSIIGQLCLSDLLCHFSSVWTDSMHEQLVGVKISLCLWKVSA
jgi:hypothetical protein